MPSSIGVLPVNLAGSPQPPGSTPFGPARNFNGAWEVIAFDPGGLAALDAGPLTVAALVKLNDTVDGGLLVARDNTNAMVFWTEVFGGRYSMGTNTSRQFAAPLDVASPDDGWHVIVFTKPDGTATPRAHRRKLAPGSTWEHANGFGTLNDVRPITATGHFYVGQYDIGPGENLAADVALVGVKAADTSDGALEALNLHSHYSAWQSLFSGATSALWPFNQADVATAVPDATGNGALQAGRSDTTVVTGPSGFYL